jgi:hypothetical protein
VTASMDQYPNTMLQLWWLTTRLYSLLPSWLILSFLHSCPPPKDLSKLFSFVCCCRVLIQTFKQVLSLSLTLCRSPAKQTKLKAQKLRSSKAQSSKFKTQSFYHSSCCLQILSFNDALISGKRKI